MSKGEHKIVLHGIKANLRVEGLYPDGSVEVAVLDMTGDVYTIATACVDDVDVPDGHLLIRDGFENEGLAQALTVGRVGKCVQRIRPIYALYQVTDAGLLRAMKAKKEEKNGKEDM